MYKQIIIASALALASSSGFAASFDSLDENGDNKVTKDEYFGTISDWGTYSDWDLDGDGFVERDEFDDVGFEAAYDYWDYNNDGFIDSYEAYSGIYHTYDANDDGYWANGEWHDFDDAGLYD